MKVVVAFWLAVGGLLHAAGLEFEALLKEVHADVDSSSVTTDFKFTNTSDKPISIRKFDAACSCMGVQISGGKLHYAPGESGVVRTTFAMGNFSGTVDKTAALWIDDDPAGVPSKTLTVRVHIPVLVEVTPKTLQWNVGAEAKPQTIRIVMNHKKPIHVTQFSGTSEAFKHELKTIKEGKEYEVEVTPMDTSRPGMAVFRIETDCDITQHRIQQAFAVVRRPLPGDAGAAQPAQPSQP